MTGEKLKEYRRAEAMAVEKAQVYNDFIGAKLGGQPFYVHVASHAVRLTDDEAQQIEDRLRIEAERAVKEFEDL